MTTRLPLMVAQLNDGIEPQFPGSQVVETMKHAQVGLFDELDRDLDEQLLDAQVAHFDCYQGPLGTERGALGIVIETGLMAPVAAPIWTPLTAGRYTHPVLVLRVDYNGCPLSLFTTKRPGKAHAALWPEFNHNLRQVARAERALGRVVIGGLDADAPDDADLQTQTRLTWTAPHDGSIVGILTSWNVQVLACTQLVATGEHPPVLVWVRVPQLNP